MLLLLGSASAFCPGGTVEEVRMGSRCRRSIGGPVAVARPPHHRDGDSRRATCAFRWRAAASGAHRLQLRVLRQLRMPAATSGVASTATATAAAESAAAAAASTTTDVHLRRRPAARHGAVPAVSKRYVPHNRRVQRDMHPTAAALFKCVTSAPTPTGFACQPCAATDPNATSLQFCNTTCAAPPPPPAYKCLVDPPPGTKPRQACDPSDPGAMTLEKCYQTCAPPATPRPAWPRIPMTSAGVRDIFTFKHLTRARASARTPRC